MNAVNLSVAGLAIMVAACNREVKRNAPPPDSAIAAPAANPAPAAAGQRAGNVGISYTRLPAGTKYLDGAVLHSAYDLAHVSTPEGDRVWLDTLAGGSKTVLAQLTVPQLAKDERLFMASCDAGGKLDPAVIAIVVTEPNATRFTKIRQAWRVDVAARRFDLIPVGGIVCEEPGS